MMLWWSQQFLLEKLYLGNRCGDGLVAKSCLTPVTPMDCSPPGSSVHGILVLPGKNTGVGCHFLLPDPGIEPRSPALQADFFPTELPDGCHLVHMWRLNQLIGLNYTRFNGLFYLMFCEAVRKTLPSVFWRVLRVVGDLCVMVFSGDNKAIAAQIVFWYIINTLYCIWNRGVLLFYLNCF